MSVPIVFVDTETTSLADDREVWEIAMIRHTTEVEPERTFQAFVEVDLATANLKSLEIGGFYRRHPLGIRLASGDRISPSELPYPSSEGHYYKGYSVAAQVASWTHGAHIVGAVPSFDMEALARLLRRHSLTPAWHYHLIDIESMALGWLRARGGPWWQHSDIQEILPWQFDDLLEACDVIPLRASDVELPDKQDRHTALEDARKVRDLWDRITGAAP